jgi:hypothetical protein
MLKWLKLSQHHHSGRLRPHEHTSYVPLGVLLLVVGVALTAFTSYAASPPPGAGSVGLSGTMPGKAPTVAATITSPGNQQRFSTSPVKFTGTCPATTLVEIFKNDIFAGSTPCSDAGTYSVDIDLLIGQNVVVARVYDALNQPGPDSNSVTVFYDALPPQSSPISALNFGGSQLLLNTDAVFRGVFPEEQLNIPIDILGGTPPFAINIQWGDSNNKVVPRNDNTAFKVGHVYNKPGTYQVSIQASDAVGRVAFLTVASIVNGQPSVAATSTPTAAATSKLLLLWPLYTASIAVVISFWMGEKREKNLLAKRGLLLPS